MFGKLFAAWLEESVAGDHLRMLAFREPWLSSAARENNVKRQASLK
ncbi:MAG: hypothetical protein QOJ88_19 [Pyrinomonadaceae bacterium]|jgi:hypothetical protein|nr:hypothetical protein [Pyrinomonadaceae bacterium]